MTVTRSTSAWLRWVALVLALASVYVVTARLGLMLALPPEKKATAVWPPSGIALVALLLLGGRVWPGVWLGAFLANLWDYFNPTNHFPLTAHLFVSAGIATGSTLQAAMGTYLIQRWTGTTRPLQRAAHAFMFAGVAMLMCLIAATFGVASLYLGGFAPVSAVAILWWTWWLGDATGVLTVGTLLLTWSRLPPLTWAVGRLAEAGLLLLLLSALASAIFGIFSPLGTLPPPLAYLVIPFLVWAAFRFGLHGAVTALVLVSASAVVGTAQATGPFAQPTVGASLLLLQVFLGVVSVTVLVMAAVLAERQGAEDEAQRSEERLRSVVNHIIDGIITIDERGLVQSFNPAAEQVFGYTASEVVGQNVKMLMPEPYHGQHDGYIANYLCTGQAKIIGVGREVVGQRKDGSTFPMDLAISVFTLGKTRHFTGIVRDITERKLAEEQVRDRERRFATLASATPGFLFTHLPNGGSDFVSRKFYEYTGMADGSALGHGWTEAVHPDDRAGAAAHFLACLRAKTMFERKYRFRSAEGSYRWFLARSVPLLDDTGQILKWYGICTDIDDQVSAEELLRESRQRYELAITGSHDGIWDWDIRGNRNYFSDRCLQMWGCDPDPSLHVFGTWADRIHPDDRDGVLAAVQRHLTERVPYDTEYRGRTESGEWRWYRSRGQAVWDDDGQPIRMAGSMTDITDRKQLEERLRDFNQQLEQQVAERTRQLGESERRFRAIFDSQFQFIGLMSPEGVLVEANRTALAAAGVEETDVLGKPFWETAWWTHDVVQQQRLRDAVRRAAVGEMVRFEASHPAPDGAMIWVDFSLTPFRDESGRIVLLIPEGRDITQRKQAEAALRASEERFRLAVKATGMGVWDTVFPLSTLGWDSRLKGIWGLSDDASVTFDQIVSLTHPDDWPGVEKELARSLDRNATGAVTLEHRIVRPDGSVGWVSAWGHTLFSSEGQPARSIGVMLDITQRKRVTEQIQASLHEKELLLKEIHHRVKNNLQIVCALLDLQSGYTSDARSVNMFKESRGRVRSMALIHERLYRSRDLARVAFGEYIEQLAADLYRSYRVSDEAIHFDIDIAIPPLPIDLAIPCGLLLNELMTNCFKHAFAGAREGTLRVSLRQEEGSNVLIVADDGPGLPEGIDLQNSPSFGLQLVNTLVEQLDGQLEMTTRPGTTFVIRFPTSQESQEVSRL